MSFLVINVEDAESYFGTDQYKDAADLRSPVIYIAPNDVYATHTVIAENIDVLVRLVLFFVSTSATDISMTYRYRNRMIPCVLSSLNWEELLLKLLQILIELELKK